MTRARAAALVVALLPFTAYGPLTVLAVLLVVWWRELGG